MFGLVVKIAVIASSSASSVSVFGIFGLGSTMDFFDKGLYLNVFTNSFYIFLAHLPLHFLLAVYVQP